jgi:hypothetical protein
MLIPTFFFVVVAAMPSRRRMRLSVLPRLTVEWSVALKLVGCCLREFWFCFYMMFRL